MSHDARAGGDGAEEQDGQRGESQLVDQHGFGAPPGQGPSPRPRRPGGDCPAAKRIAARVVMSHRGDEMDAEADRGASAVARPRPGRTTPRRVSPRRSLSRARASRLRSVPAGQRSRLRRLVEGQALEVTEHHRQSEGVRQAVDLFVEDLGLLASQGRLLGRRDRRLDRDARIPTLTPHGVAVLVSATAIEPDPGLPRRADRHPVEPGAQQVGVADGEGLAGEHEEDGLEGVLGVVPVTQEIWRQTRRTIGPCRVTSAANAASPAASRPAVNRSNSCRSVRPATEPPSKSDSICRTIDPVAACAMPFTSPAEI